MTNDTIFYWEPEYFSHHEWESFSIHVEEWVRTITACRFCGRRSDVDILNPQECVSLKRKKEISRGWLAHQAMVRELNRSPDLQIATHYCVYCEELHSGDEGCYEY